MACIQSHFCSNNPDKWGTVCCLLFGVPSALYPVLIAWMPASTFPENNMLKA